ncbi:MAG TPA: hypothetical protein PLV41_06645 [Miltoncostaeales bacterium]|nr:hypothetical protein [Miltoncostaeales bacterium]
MSAMPDRPSNALTEASSGTAQIHDISFAGYDGERTAVAKVPLILAWWSVLRAFGRRRGWVAKFVPFSLLGLAFMPAVGVLTVRGLFADTLDEIQLPVEMLPYSDYLGIIGTMIVLWTALVTPELVCPDIQHRVTSLYFATAVSPTRYVFGKWLASFGSLLAMTLLPVLLLWVGNIMFAPSVTDALRADLDQLPRIVGAGVIVAVFFSTLGLAIAAMTGRRAYAIGALVGLILGSGVLSGVVSNGGNDRLGAAVNLVGVPLDLAQRLFGDNGISVVTHAVSYVIIVGLSAFVLLNRFRSRA